MHARRKLQKYEKDDKEQAPVPQQESGMPSGPPCQNEAPELYEHIGIAERRISGKVRARLYQLETR